MDPNLQGMKQGHPFLITGLGASGTRWLAIHLNSSLTWKVWHEPNNAYYLDPKPFTGTVDSTVRHTQAAEEYLDDGRLAVIIRDPRDIAEHCVCKGTWKRVKNEIVRDIIRLQRLLDEGAIPFWFRDFGRRPYVRSIELWAGIHDIPMSHTVPILGRAKRDNVSRGARKAARNELNRHSKVLNYLKKWLEIE